MFGFVCLYVCLFDGFLVTKYLIVQPLVSEEGKSARLVGWLVGSVVN
jgi:hypothetical protein